VAAVGLVLMGGLGAVVVPAARLGLWAFYGIVGDVVLAPFGLAPPRAAGFVLAGLLTAVLALAAGRRVGALLAHQAVRGRLGSDRLMTALAWIAGVAGALAFVAAVPGIPLPDADAPWPYRVAYALAGSFLPLAALVAGPPLGLRRYLTAHPYCHACGAWLERETGGGAFTEPDAGHLLAALAADRYGELRDLPLAARGRSYTLRWWACQNCHEEAFLTCLPEEGGAAGAPVLSRRVVGRPVRELRALVGYRQRLRDGRR
jgi:hypothetical protein